MVKILSSDRMFAHAMGRPEVTIRREDTDGREGVVSFAGPAASISFQSFERSHVWMRIYPSTAVMQALDCGLMT
jgi:hypothetical protein